MTSRIRAEVMAGTGAAADFVFSLVQRVPQRPQWQAVCRDSTTSPPVRPRRMATHNALIEAPPTGSSRSEGRPPTSCSTGRGESETTQPGRLGVTRERLIDRVDDSETTHPGQDRF